MIPKPDSLLLSALHYFMRSSKSPFLIPLTNSRHSVWLLQVRSLCSSRMGRVKRLLTCSCWRG